MIFKPMDLSQIRQASSNFFLPPMNSNPSIHIKKLGRTSRKLILSLSLVLISLFTVVSLVESLLPHPQPGVVTAKRRDWFGEKLVEYDENNTFFDYEYE